jgi:hypothetical protein
MKRRSSSAKVKVDPRDADFRYFKPFHLQRLRPRLMQAACAYVYMDPPPMCLTAEGALDFKAWSVGGAGTGAMHRGEWISDLLMDGTERKLVGDLKHLLGEYSRKAGVPMQDAANTATEMGFFVDIPAEVMAEHAPFAAPEPGSTHAVYLHSHYARSMLPRPKEAQRLSESFHDVLRARAAADCSAPRAEFHGEPEHDARVRALHVWTAKLAQRHYDAACLMAFFDTLTATGFSTRNVVTLIPWIVDVVEHFDAAAAFTDANMPVRGDIQYAQRTGAYRTLPNGFESWREPARALAGMRLAFDHLRVMALRLMAARRAWSEDHPRYPSHAFTPAVILPHQAPNWLVAWGATLSRDEVNIDSMMMEIPQQSIG